MTSFRTRMFSQTLHALILGLSVSLVQCLHPEPSREELLHIYELWKGTSFWMRCGLCACACACVGCVCVVCVCACECVWVCGVCACMRECVCVCM